MVACRFAKPTFVPARFLRYVAPRHAKKCILGSYNAVCSSFELAIHVYLLWFHAAWGFCQSSYERAHASSHCSEGAKQTTHNAQPITLHPCSRVRSVANWPARSVFFFFTSVSLAMDTMKQESKTKRLTFEWDCHSVCSTQVASCQKNILSSNLGQF